MEDKALGLLGLMRRARAIEVGSDSACDAVRAGKAKLLILSADIADNARRKAEKASDGRRAPVLDVHYTRAELGSALGVAECSAAALTELGFAEAFAKALASASPERYAEIAGELERRREKNARRKREKTERADSKRNGKRRTEA